MTEEEQKQAEEKKKMEEQKKLEEKKADEKRKADEDRKTGELKYLREEIKQILEFSYGHSQNTIKMILGIWAGIAVVLGWMEYYKVVSMQASLNLLIPFACMTIFFISVWVLYFSTLKIRSNVESLLKIAAYIMVFHEKKPGEAVTYCWETAQFETDIIAEAENCKNSKLFNENNSETMYEVFMAFSAVGILISPVMFFGLGESINMLNEFRKFEGGAMINMLLIICILYISCSIVLFFKILIPFQKTICERKQEHLKRFLKYSYDINNNKKQFKSKFLYWLEDGLKKIPAEDPANNKDWFKNFWGKLVKK